MKKIIFVAIVLSLGWFAVAKADTKTVTPQEFGQAVASVPGKVAGHIASEWEQIKIYQKANWLKMKDRFSSLKNKFTSN